MAFLMPIRDVIIEFLKRLFVGVGLRCTCSQGHDLGKHALEIEDLFLDPSSNLIGDLIRSQEKVVDLRHSR